MPRKYKRKPGVVSRHINWTEDSLALAFEDLNKKQKSINEIYHEICHKPGVYGISSRTLRRQYEQRNQLLVTQGKYPVLGFENEKRLVSHIPKLGDAGFPPERSLIRQLAYQFAEKLELKHNFNNETKMAGPQWLKSFLERNSEIVVRQAEEYSYPVNPNALSDAEFAISDIAFGELTQEQESVTINDKVQIKITQYTPPRPSLSLLALSHECLALEDGEIENYILDNTELSLPSLISLNELQNKDLQKETPSKFLHQLSPIPKIPLSMSKKAKQSAEVLNSNDKIIKKKNKTERVKKTSIMKQTKETINNPVGNKDKITKKRERPQKNKKSKQYRDLTSSESESDSTDGFIELTKGWALRKRKNCIYSSNSENEENVINSKISKGKATKGLPMKGKKNKTSTRDTENILKVINSNSKKDITNKEVKVDNYCAECFENYNLTKSISDWIQCEMCRMWLHETCTTFKNHCMRCGKLKTLASDDNQC